MAHARIISMEDPARHDGEGVNKWKNRRAYVLNTLLPQTQKMGFESAELFPAVTGEHFTRENGFAVYQDLKLKINEGCIGNFLSNVMLWRLCIDLDQAVLVMEDDALLPEAHMENISQAIREYENQPDAQTILFLLGQTPYGSCELRNYKNASLRVHSENLRLVEHYHDWAGTAAYCVRPKAARHLLDRALEFGTNPSDKHLHLSASEGMNDFVIPVQYDKLFLLTSTVGGT